MHHFAAGDLRGSRRAALLRGVLALSVLLGACKPLSNTLDYGDLPWVRSNPADMASSSCVDLSLQWRDLAAPLVPDEAPVQARRSTARRTFYVSPSGDDAASGEQPDQAWRSLERVNQQLLAPGESVLLQGGASFAGTLRIEHDDSGSVDAPVIISSYGEGRARIDAGDGSAIEIASAGGLWVHDLILQGAWDAPTQQGNTGFGVHAENRLGGGARLRLLKLSQLEISGFREAGVAIDAQPADGAKGNGYEGVEIAYCDVHDNGDSGVVTGGPYNTGPGYSHRGVLIHHVRAYRNRGLAHKGGHTGSGIIMADVDGGAIERCVAHDNGEFNDHEAGGGFGIWAWDSNAVVIQHNEAYANQSMTADGGGFDLDGGMTHSWLQYNYSHENHGAGFGAFQFAFARPYGANVIRYNISQNDGIGFSLWDASGDLEALAIHNNVSYGQYPALQTHSQFRSVRLLHNIFYGTGPTLLDVAVGAGLTLQGNAYFSDEQPFRVLWNTNTTGEEYDSLQAFRTGTRQELREGLATGVQGDPRLIAAGGGGVLDDAEQLGSLEAYQLSEDSPLIDRGLDLGNYDLEPGCQDFFGNPIPQGAALDIGVHERR